MFDDDDEQHQADSEEIHDQVIQHRAKPRETDDSDREIDRKTATAQDYDFDIGKGEYEFKSWAEQRLRNFANQGKSQNSPPRPPAPVITSGEARMPDHKQPDEDLLPAILPPDTEVVNAEPGDECPPEDAPTHMAVHVEYLVVEGLIIDCDGSVEVTAEGDVEDDLTYAEVDEDCVACINGSDFATLIYSCHECFSGDIGTYNLSLTACLRWDGSTWWIDTLLTVSTPEDFGICGFSTDNGALLSFEEQSDDIGSGDPIGTHMVNLSGQSGSIEAVLTVVLS